MFGPWESTTSLSPFASNTPFYTNFVTTSLAYALVLAYYSICTICCCSSRICFWCSAICASLSLPSISYNCSIWNCSFISAWVLRLLEPTLSRWAPFPLSATIKRVVKRSTKRKCTEIISTYWRCWLSSWRQQQLRDLARCSNCALPQFPRCGLWCGLTPSFWKGPSRWCWWCWRWKNVEDGGYHVLLGDSLQPASTSFRRQESSRHLDRRSTARKELGYPLLWYLKQQWKRSQELTLLRSCDEFFEEVDGDTLVLRQVCIDINGHELVDLSLRPELSRELFRSYLIFRLYSSAHL